MGWIVFQFAVSVAAGIGAVWWDRYLWGGDMEHVAYGLTMWAAFFGFCVARGVMFLIVWARFGWASARSMRMLD